LILLEITARGIRLRHASLSSLLLGERLSNTSIIYPEVGHKIEKLIVIPHRRLRLEGAFFKSFGASG